MKPSKDAWEQLDIWVISNYYKYSKTFYFAIQTSSLKCIFHFKKYVKLIFFEKKVSTVELNTIKKYANIDTLRIKKLKLKPFNKIIVNLILFCPV